MCVVVVVVVIVVVFLFLPTHSSSFPFMLIAIISYRVVHDRVLCKCLLRLPVAVDCDPDPVQVCRDTHTPSAPFFLLLLRLLLLLKGVVHKNHSTWEWKTNEIFPIKKMTMMHLHPNLLTFCMDWCCHYGPNCLFKIGFCWITYEVDYLNQNHIITKTKKLKF